MLDLYQLGDGIVSDQVEILRSIASANAEHLATLDPHLKSIAEIVEAVEHRWKKNSDAGGDPRLQVRHFGSLACRFNGELARIVVARLEHLLRAAHSPFKPKVRTDVDLGAVGRADLAVVEAHCTAFESENRRRA